MEAHWSQAARPGSAGVGAWSPVPGLTKQSVRNRFFDIMMFFKLYIGEANALDGLLQQCTYDTYWRFLDGAIMDVSREHLSDS